MLKVSNKSRKNEQLDTIQIIDKCTKIMKEDRLQLRQMVKDENLKLIELITKHKKKNDLNDLQSELRKFLKDKKGSPERVQGAPVVLRKVKSKERCEWNTSISSNPSIRSPSRSNLDFKKKQKEESYKKMESLKKQEKLENQIFQKENDDNKILDEIQEVKPEQQTVLFNSANSIVDPFQEDLTPVKMEFQTIVSQVPLNQSDQRSECILQYFEYLINQYLKFQENNNQQLKVIKQKKSCIVVIILPLDNGILKILIHYTLKKLTLNGAMRVKFKLIQVNYSFKPIGFNLEFKYLIQDGDNFILETIQKRIHKCDFRSNFLYITFNKPTMNIRQILKYEISNEFVQEEYIQAKFLLVRVKDLINFQEIMVLLIMLLIQYGNLQIQSLIMLASQYQQQRQEEIIGLTNISINQLEIDWKQLIKSHFECKLKIKVNII